MESEPAVEWGLLIQLPGREHPEMLGKPKATKEEVLRLQDVYAVYRPVVVRREVGPWRQEQ